MKHLVFNLLMFTGMVGAAQTDFQNKTFTYEAQSGYGAKRKIVLKLSATEEELLNSKDYQEHLAEFYADVDTDTLSKPRSIDLMLRHRTGMGLIEGKYKLKNPSSLDFPEDAQGTIFVSDKDQRMTIYIPIKAQNGYGAYLFGSLYINKTATFISMN